MYVLKINKMPEIFFPDFFFLGGGGGGGGLGGNAPVPFPTPMGSVD